MQGLPEPDANATVRALAADELGDALSAATLDAGTVEDVVVWLVNRAVDDPDERVQEAALHALAAAFDGYRLPLQWIRRLRSNLAALSPALLAEYGLYILAATHDPAVRPDIAAHRGHPDGAVRRAVEEALGELIGRPAGGRSISAGMPRIVSAVPVLPVLDVPSAAERFRRLGFDVELVDPDVAAYAFARRDDVVLHLAGVDEHPENADVCVYLHVDDADALFAAWSAAGVEGRWSAPVDTPYGLREGNYIDPDGILFRFGSPLTPQR